MSSYYITTPIPTLDAETRTLAARETAISFGVFLGMRIVDGAIPASFCAIRAGGGKYDGITYVGNIDLDFICHEIAHYQVASIDRRHLNDYGNYSFNMTDFVKITESKDDTLIIPEFIEEGRASILGDLHRQRFEPNSKSFVFGKKGMIARFPVFKSADAERWLIKHGFIVDGQATNKLNHMTIFESFAEYF